MVKSVPARALPVEQRHAPRKTKKRLMGKRSVASSQKEARQKRAA
jgi:hypothetical protein